jgi:hypothetical protein
MFLARSGVVGGVMLRERPPRVLPDVRHRYNYKLGDQDAKRRFTFLDKY